MLGVLLYFLAGFRLALEVTTLAVAHPENTLIVCVGDKAHVAPDFNGGRAVRS